MTLVLDNLASRLDGLGCLLFCRSRPVSSLFPFCFRFSGGFQTGLRFLNALHELLNLAVFVGLHTFPFVFHGDNLPTIKNHDVLQWHKKLCNLDRLAIQGHYIRTSTLMLPNTRLSKREPRR